MESFHRADLVVGAMSFAVTNERNLHAAIARRHRFNAQYDHDRASVLRRFGARSGAADRQDTGYAKRTPNSGSAKRFTRVCPTTA
ncbi:hypothetical protein [Paraburkholderia atlantica]|uniref:hypothetical protein n=1 Tax=Paraburkholderia atlantica TaxID=2654982 RepID=UPI001611D789|nr:hypothetical protein [Paraburkholderia atlantica]MBB5504734.1 outer membrane protein TolC [Paraburkholderia atlantica]